MRRVLLSALFVATATACSSPPASSSFERPYFAPDSGGEPLPSIAPDASLLGDGATPPVVTCTDAALLVYVVSEAGDLYSFDPPSNALTKIGPLRCPADLSYANSMAIDRAGNAWINYSDGRLYKASTKDGSCVDSGMVPGQAGVTTFGMGFSTDGQAASSETLFVCDLGGRGLGRIDLATKQLSLVGGGIPGQGCELTGTGDGRLFAFFAGSTNDPTRKVSLAEITKGSLGVASNAPLTGHALDKTTSWAFSFYGGDFYLYVADRYDPTNANTNIIRYRPSDGTLVEVKHDLGMRISGAGVSTCVPTTPPPPPK